MTVIKFSVINPGFCGCRRILNFIELKRPSTFIFIFEE